MFQSSRTIEVLNIPNDAHWMGDLTSEAKGKRNSGPSPVFRANVFAAPLKVIDAVDHIEGWSKEGTRRPRKEMPVMSSTREMSITRCDGAGKLHGAGSG
jgi:hypothetical protein